jgi:hypothetical protein
MTRSGRNPAQARSPVLRTAPCTHAAPITPVDRPTLLCRLFAFSRLAFPVVMSGRRPRQSSRGLLRLHSRCGLRTCSTSFRGLCLRASGPPVTQWACRTASEGVDLFLGRDFHPRVAVHLHGAHHCDLRQGVGVASRRSRGMPPSSPRAPPRAPPGSYPCRESNASRHEAVRSLRPLLLDAPDDPVSPVRSPRKRRHGCR